MKEKLKQYSEILRPASFDQVVGQDHVVVQMKGVVASGRTGNFLFVGPSGSGKSTLARILANQMIQGDASVNMVHLRAGECSFDIIRKELDAAGRYKPMNGSLRAVILDDAHHLKPTMMEKLRTFLEFQSSPFLFVATCEKERWSASLRSRFRIVRFNVITTVAATLFLKQVWHRLSRPGVAPTLQQLQLSSGKHYNLREVLNQLESWIDARGKVEVPPPVRRPARTRRIAGALIVALSCKQGRQFTPMEAFAKLSKSGIEEFKTYVLSQFSSDISAEDWESFNWPPSPETFDRYAREGLKYLDDKGIHWAEGGYHFPHTT